MISTKAPTASPEQSGSSKVPVPVELLTSQGAKFGYGPSQSWNSFCGMCIVCGELNRVLVVRLCSIALVSTVPSSGPKYLNVTSITDIIATTPA